MSPRIHEHVKALLSSREAELRAWGKGITVTVCVLALVTILAALSYAYAFGPPGDFEERSEFVISPEDTLFTVATRLEAEGYVKYAAAFRFMHGVFRGDRTFRPGGYKLSPSMHALEVSKKLTEAPYLVWVSIPEGRRKEEIAELLAETLGWSSQEQEEWLAATNQMSEMVEGVFYPDIYLIPSDQPPAQIVARLRGRFDEVTAPYVIEAYEKKMSWKEVVTLASLIEREAAKNDKHLVSGILHNRLARGMPLQVDATLQYLRGSQDNWWPSPDPDDKDMDSPFNTYVYKDLPPEPIATPSLEAIEAALNPEATKCLYYLHDEYGRIHCSATYSAHTANVKRYLR